MPNIMIKCPVTGKAVPTDMAMDKKSFESVTLKNNTLVNCPVCGQNHTWSKEDSFLGE